MRHLLIPLALTLAACSDAPPPAVADGAVDAQLVDASPVDADLDAVDAPPGPCPASTDQPILPPAAPPTGAYRGRWTCVADCLSPPASDVPATTDLQIAAGGQLAWRGPGGAIVAQAVASGNCWRVARDDARCGTSFDVCPSGTCGTSPCVRVMFASWYSTSLGRWQTWEFRATPP